MGRFEGNLVTGNFSAYAGTAVPLHRPLSSDPFPELTTRQREVLQMLSTGLTDKQIAYELGISTATVKCHTRAAVQRMEAKNRLHAVALYVRGQVELERAF
ncbi:helix-turn-helix domain-containing protein [Roseibium aggregatum]|uniref:Helix-turn-helix transcriptional regulator n=1 Tax=Roseibium aggregatum TaxID=187304 RepID=A0A926S334_9HYPH|nr:helix-turn-helix transcriptional regulator [Roseibium aggregatum]MBD1544898.1 helix-turn-helix transcriptional regulator [Roseibium aggregatum]